MKKITALFLLALASLAQSPPFVPSSSSGGASGPAGGDLAGTYPNPTIPLQIQDTGLLGPFTAAQIQGMFGAPIVLVAAPGAGKTIRIVAGLVDVVYAGVAFTAGGNFGLFYGSTSPPLTTNQASALGAATVITGLTANTLLTINPNGASLVGTTYLNLPLTLSNLTQAFAGGTGSTFYVEVKYYIQSGLQ